MQREKIRDADVIDALKKVRIVYCIDVVKLPSIFHTELILRLRQENQQGLMRVSALTMEHREVKNHWLAEKGDLQTRIFQVQALNTQASGSLKKCEKDFVKLQNQLAKIVKDGNKAQAKPAIVMSLPVQKNLTQGTAAQGSAASLLKDAEIQASKKTINTLDVSEPKNSALNYQLIIYVFFAGREPDFAHINGNSPAQHGRASRLL